MESIKLFMLAGILISNLMTAAYLYSISSVKKIIPVKAKAQSHEESIYDNDEFELDQNLIKYI